MIGTTPEGGLPPTPSQTVGPYFASGCEWDDGPFAVPRGDRRARSAITGTIFDGAGEPDPRRPDRDLAGRPRRPLRRPPTTRRRGRAGRGFRGFARSPDGRRGQLRILTLKPGPVPGPGETVQAPHIDVSVFARGLLARLVTRIYFADEEAANAADPVLGQPAGGERSGRP